MTSDPAAASLNAPAQSEEKTRNFHLWMDAFRTIAAAMVMVSHARDITLQDYSGIIWSMPIYFASSLGHTGVVLFFVMSGYWISASVVSRIAGQSFWPEYLIARLSRLWVVLLPALVLGGLLDFYGGQIIQLPAYQNVIGSHSLSGDVAERLGLSTFLANAFFLQTIVAPTWGSNGPLWSLSAEFWYYLFFPTLVILVSRKRKVPWLVLLASVAVSVVNLQIAIGFFVWLLGYGLQIIRRDGKLERAFGNPLIVWLSFALLLSAFVLNALHKDSVPDLVMGVIFSAFLLALRASPPRFPTVLDWLALYGRKSSFSLYAIHFPIVMLLGGLAVGNARYPVGVAGILVLLAICATCFALAFVFSLATEWKTDQVRRKMGAVFSRVAKAA